MNLLWLIRLYLYTPSLMFFDILLELGTEFINVLCNCCIVVGVDELVYRGFAILAVLYFIFVGAPTLVCIS